MSNQHTQYHQNPFSVLHCRAVSCVFHSHLNDLLKELRKHFATSSAYQRNDKITQRVLRVRCLERLLPYSASVCLLPLPPGGLRHIRYLLYIYDVNYLRKHCCCDAGGGIEREARTKKRGLEGTGCIALFTVNYVVASCDRNLVLVASGLGGIR